MIKYEMFVVEFVRKNETAYSFLKNIGLTENFLNKIRQNKNNLKINNLFENLSKKVCINDKIEINTNPFEKSNIPPCNLPLNIVFEDDYMLVINKPHGLATMPTSAHYQNNLAGAIVNYMNSKDENFVCRIINRLDKDVSGLVLVSKTSIYSKFLLDNSSKTYFAIVNGKIEKPLTIDKKIATTLNKEGTNNQKREISNLGKSAKTIVTPIKVFDNKTLCSITIEGGRTHQIRLHLSHVGYSILGDKLYGNFDEFDGIALIAKKMQVVHPKTKLLLNFECDYPQNFLNLDKKNI